MQNLLSVIELSRGSTWQPTPSDPPYLRAPIGDSFPASAYAYVNFYDTAGNQLAQFDLPVTRDAILPLADSGDVDAIPAGAVFEVFIDSGVGPQMIRHGKVIRRQANFTTLPASQTSVISRLFSDGFPTLGVRSNWKAVLGRVKIYSGPPHAMATDNIFYDKAAVRWEEPLNGDSPLVHVQLTNPGAGNTGVIVCADQRFTSYLSAQFVSGVGAANKIQLCTGSGPVTTSVKANFSHTVADLDDYYVGFSEMNKTLTVYQGTDLTPLVTWADVDELVPHGPGYRYTGLTWKASLVSTGIRVCSWSAKDSI